MKFIVQSDDIYLLKAIRNEIVWTVDVDKANTYPSKYAAKKHLRTLDNVPEDVRIIELVSTEENLNG